MPRILLFIAIPLIFFAGIISFKTKGRIVAIQDDLKNAHQATATSETARKKALDEVKQGQEQLAAATTAKEAAEADAKAAKADAEKVKSDLEGVKTQITAKETEITELKAKIAEATTTPAGNNAADTEGLEKQIKEAQTKLAEQVEIAKSLEAKTKAAEEHAAALEQEKKRRIEGLNAPGLEGKVLAVSPNWNFVVLSIGDRQGVAPNSTLLVKRGNALVGKLHVKSVDPSTSIADIVPGSVPKGAFLRPGDVVIYSGS